LRGDVVLVEDAEGAVIGSGQTATARIEGRGVEAAHARIRGHEVEALAACSVGGVALAAGGTRILVSGVTIALGDAELVVDDDPDLEEVATRDLALRALAPGGAAVPTVVVAEGPDRGRRLELAEQRDYVVGRGEGVDLSIQEPRVSRAHVELRRESSRVMIRDLGATAGTYLGADRLAPGRPATWRRGAMLRIGTSVLALALPPWMKDDEDAPAEDVDTGSTAPQSVGGESIPSLRIATSASEAAIAEVPKRERGAPSAPQRRALPIAVVAVPLTLLIAATLVLLVIVLTR
jgi:pSer/pThr/pTyr-binding forkhead associated (FHA) protein